MSSYQSRKGPHHMLRQHPVFETMRLEGGSHHLPSRVWGEQEAGRALTMPVDPAIWSRHLYRHLRGVSGSPSRICGSS